jgi:hypothetical protein
MKLLSSSGTLFSVFSVARCEHPRRTVDANTSKADKLAKTQGRVATSVPSISTFPSASPKEDDPPNPPAGNCSLVNRDCPTGFFCDIPAESCLSDAPGYCRAMGDYCPEIYSPVCGCDNSTYSNACKASSAGINIMHTGDCLSYDPVLKCTSIGGESLDCLDGTFCKVLEGTCLTSSNSNAYGYCTPITTSCEEIYAPVCGCDNVTYNNECMASTLGINIAHSGVCESEEPPAKCTLIDEESQSCPDDSFCKVEDGACHQSPVDGYCAEMKPHCPQHLDPVCGCDGMTYDNSCIASSFGVNIGSIGGCKSLTPSPTVKASPGKMGQECSISKPCLQGLKCYLPPPDAPYQAGMCGCESNDDCMGSPYGSLCIEADYLQRPPYLKAKLCAQCHPINQIGCDPTSNFPFCDQGFGYVECTCQNDDHCPGDEKCGTPLCIADIVRSCSLDHDAEWGC